MCTPSRDIPEGALAEAGRLLQDGGPAVAQRLGMPVARAALERQALEAGDILAAVGRKGGLRPSGRSHLVAGSREHVQQLLAQVLWEESLLREEQAAARRDDGFGGAPSETLRTTRSAKTAWPISRPLSAGAARVRLVHQDHRESMENWATKEAVVCDARAQREAALLERQARARGCNDFRTEHCATWKEDQRRQQLDRASGIMKDEARKEAVFLARFRAEQSSFQGRRAQSASIRTASARMTCEDSALDRQEDFALEYRASCARRAQAETKRQEHLKTKAMGKMQLREARDLARWQHGRIQRLREMKRSQLAGRLSEPPVFSHHLRLD